MLNEDRAGGLGKLLVEDDGACLGMFGLPVEERPISVACPQENATLPDERAFRAVARDEPVGALFREVEIGQRERAGPRVFAIVAQRGRRSICQAGGR